MARNLRTLALKTELDYIENKYIYDLVYSILENEVPSKFFVAPASSTGKHHSAMSQGVGGLLRHSKAAVYFAVQMLNLEHYSAQFIEKEKDYMVAALILHDVGKYGVNGELEFTTPHHPMLVREMLFARSRNCSPLDEYLIDVICSVIETHHGEWNTSEKDPTVLLPKPMSSMQKFVHTCDFLASRSEVNLTHDVIHGNLSIISGLYKQSDFD